MRIVLIDSLDEVVPEDTRWILQDTNKDAHFRRLVLNCGTCMAILHAEQLAEFAKAREAPVAFLSNETMVCICKSI